MRHAMCFCCVFGYRVNERSKLDVYIIMSSLLFSQLMSLPTNTVRGYARQDMTVFLYTHSPLMPCGQWLRFSTTLKR